MANDDQHTRAHERWAHLRFAVIGPLLAAPPELGDLKAQLIELALKTWRHPLTGDPVTFGVSTIERWFYAAKRGQKDPVSALKKKLRSDLGTRRAMAPSVCHVILAQHKQHGSWSIKLHHDNLRVLCEQDRTLGKLPSYPTVRRFFRENGLKKLPRRRGPRSPGQVLADERLERREVRSFEASHVGGLWHLDFHHGSLKVLQRNGEWATPFLLCILDDHSRLCCHLQWYLAETAENLVHAMMQAIMKRGLPMALLSDNGSAMIADETSEGLLRLSIGQKTTLTESPYQNGKQEVFFSQVEGRLLAMLEHERDLTLHKLNEASLAWVELEYNRKKHSEITKRHATCPRARCLEARVPQRRDQNAKTERWDGQYLLSPLRGPQSLPPFAKAAYPLRTLGSFGGVLGVRQDRHAARSPISTG
jgi:transposase InsO family protein